jgi:hypothetical protein
MKDLSKFYLIVTCGEVKREVNTGIVAHEVHITASFQLQPDGTRSGLG